MTAGAQNVDVQALVTPALTMRAVINRQLRHQRCFTVGWQSALHLRCLRVPVPDTGLCEENDAT